MCVCVAGFVCLCSIYTTSINYLASNQHVKGFAFKGRLRAPLELVLGRPIMGVIDWFPRRKLHGRDCREYECVLLEG